jgi:hypothetical protein
MMRLSRSLGSRNQLNVASRGGMIRVDFGRDGIAALGGMRRCLRTREIYERGGCRRPPTANFEMEGHVGSEVGQ